MADREKMSVQEMLAAARASAGVGPAKPAEKKPAEKEPAEEAQQPAAAEAEAPAEKPEKKEKPAPAKSGKGMSVAEMLAAARAEKSGGGAAAPKAPKAERPAAEKPAAEKPAKPMPAKKEAAAKAPAAEGKASAPDTQSILAAARKGAKSGPMSKAEAAEKEVIKPASKPKLVAPPMPERPGYVRPAVAARTQDEESRRGFFSTFLGSYLAVGFTSLGLTNLLWTLGFARFMFPNILTEPPTRFKVGPPDGFAPGAVETKFVAQFGVWVVNTVYNGQQVIFALKTVCTHLGCTPNWLDAEQKFKCPCHGSGFYKDGVNFEGPAPRPLERHAIRLAEDGQLEIDKSKIFQEEKGQWTNPNSFVPV